MAFLPAILSPIVANEIRLLNASIYVAVVRLVIPLSQGGLNANATDAGRSLKQLPGEAVRYRSERDQSRAEQESVRKGRSDVERVQEKVSDDF